MKKLLRARHFLRGHIAAYTTRLRNVKRKIARHSRRSITAARIERMKHERDRLILLGPPYRLGGAHGHTPAIITRDGGGDCSSYWSDLLQAGDVPIGTTDTSGLARELPRGRGDRVTLYIKTGAGGPEDHVIGSIDGVFTQMGGRDNTRGGRPCIFTPTASRLAEFHIAVHPPGL